MLAKHFYTIVQSEENTIDFLKERGYIEIGTPPCVHCGKRTNSDTMHKGCQRTQSVP